MINTTKGEAMKDISEMNRYELDDLENQIASRRLELTAKDVESRGFSTRLLDDIEYVLVYSPVTEMLNAWATVSECRHLLDFAANLPVEEAYHRWYPTVVEKFPAQPYTEADAERDTRKARINLARLYASGEIDGREYNELHKSTSFMDLAK